MRAGFIPNVFMRIHILIIYVSSISPLYFVLYIKSSMFVIHRLLADVDVRPYDMALFIIGTSVLSVFNLVQNYLVIFCAQPELPVACQCFVVLRESNYGSCCL